MRTPLRLSFAAAALCASVVANAELIYGVSFDNQLITFDSAAPTTIFSGLFLSGLGGADVAGLDFDADTGVLYVLGTNSTIYTANTTTGALTSFGTLSIPLNGTEFGFDDNPADGIRIVSNTDQNLRFNKIGGTTVAETPISVDSGVNPQISAIAYTNSGSPTLYGLEAVNNTLVRFPSPSGGAAVTVGALGFNASALNGFDISPNTNVAFAAVQQSSIAGSQLYTINLATGAATAVGAIGSASSAVTLRGIAIAPAPVPEPATIAGLGLGLAVLARRRRKNS